VAAPVTPSAIASMVTVPGDILVTSPVSETVATLSAALVQLTARPVSKLPDPSWGAADN